MKIIVIVAALLFAYVLISTFVNAVVGDSRPKKPRKDNNGPKIPGDPAEPNMPLSVRFEPSLSIKMFDDQRDMFDN